MTAGKEFQWARMPRPSPVQVTPPFSVSAGASQEKGISGVESSATGCDKDGASCAKRARRWRCGRIYLKPSQVTLDNVRWDALAPRARGAVQIAVSTLYADGADEIDAGLLREMRHRDTTPPGRRGLTSANTLLCQNPPVGMGWDENEGDVTGGSRSVLVGWPRLARQHTLAARVNMGPKAWTQPHVHLQSQRRSLHLTIPHFPPFFTLVARADSTCAPGRRAESASFGLCALFSFVRQSPPPSISSNIRASMTAS